MSRKHRIWSVLLGLLVLSSVIGPLVSRPGTDNLYVRQADAFLHGRLDIAEYGWDAAVVDGRYYVAFPPFPALLLTPVVAALGPAAANTIAVSLVLFSLTVIVAWRIAARLELAPDERFWVVLAFALGTPLWFALQRSDGVWCFAHIVAVFCLTLAIHEALGRGRGWLTGVFLAGAVFSRQFTLFAAIFLAEALWEAGLTEPRQRKRWLNLVGFALPLLIAGICYLWFNAVRFGHPLDSGYSYLRGSGFLLVRFKEYGLFSPAYLLFNLTYLFFQGFHVSFSAPDRLSGFELDPFGVSILAASPFVLAALFARRDRLTQMAWTTVITTAFATLFYYNNGWVQLNAQRFTLDFWSVLLVPLALGVNSQVGLGQGRLWRGLIIYAVVLNVIALVLFEPLNVIFSLWPTGY